MLPFAISWPQLHKTVFVKLIQVHGSNLILQQHREEMTLSNISVEKIPHFYYSFEGKIFKGRLIARDETQ